MNWVKDPITGETRPAEVGEKIVFPHGTEYINGKHGELRVAPSTRKELRPSKAARKARRAAELRQLQNDKPKENSI